LPGLPCHLHDADHHPLHLLVAAERHRQAHPHPERLRHHALPVETGPACLPLRGQDRLQGASPLHQGPPDANRELQQVAPNEAAAMPAHEMPA
jgi:hypothetical protein